MMKHRSLPVVKMINRNIWNGVVNKKVNPKKIYEQLINHYVNSTKIYSKTAVFLCNIH